MAGMAVTLASAITGCATQTAKDPGPVAPVDIRAIEGRWEGRSPKYGTKVTLDVFNDPDGRAIAKHCWGGWCRTTRATWALRDAKITPMSVAFTVGRTKVTYTLNDGEMKAWIDPPGRQWDQEIEFERKN